MMHPRRVLAATAIAGACALATAACGGSKSNDNSGSSGGSSGGGSSKQFVVGYSQSNNAEPYRAQLNLQLQYFIKKYPNLKLLPITDAHQDSSTQVSQVQNFVNQNVDVLIVSPNEPGPLTAPVLQACAKHIPVIILDRSVNTNCYTSFIGGDNLAIGKLAGQEAVKLLPQGGNVVELQGILSDTPQIERDKGFRDAIASNPKIKLIAHREAKWLRSDATSIMQQWLTSYPKIGVVYGQNDEMALGAYLAAAGAHRQNQVKFIGIDGLAIPGGGIRAVQQHKLAATFIYPTAAKEAAQTAEAIVSKKSVPKKQTLKTVQITPQNAAAEYTANDYAHKQ